MDLFWVLIVVGLIVRAVGNSRKKKEQQQAKRQRQTMEEIFGQDAAKPAGVQRTESKPVPRPEPITPPVTEKPGLTLEWNGESMVKAFIMQEVLTRPCERRGRR